MQSEFINLEVKDMPERFQHILKKNAPPKASKLRTFLSSYLTLMQDKDAIAELQVMIDEILVEPQLEKKVNQVQKKCKTGHKLRMNA